MAKITDYSCCDVHGQPISADAVGNNVAMKCPGCGYPVLAILQNENRRGAKASNPSICRGCKSKWWVEVLADIETLRVHAVSEG